MIRFVKLVSRPKVEILVVVETLGGFHAVDPHESAKTTPSLPLFRFDAPIVFF